MRSGPWIRGSLEREKARSDAPFWRWGSFARCERCRVPKLRQERVLIVLAAARHNFPLVIKVADFAEWQRHPASSGLKR